MRVFTHVNMTLRSAAALFAIRALLPAAYESALVFVPADWNGCMDESDLAIEVEAGGRGIASRLGPDGTVESALAAIVARYPAHDEDDREAWRRFVDLVEAEHASPDSGLNVVLRGFKAQSGNRLGSTTPGLELDRKVYLKMHDVFRAIMDAEQARLRAERAERAGDDKVAIFTHGTCKWDVYMALFDKDVRVIVATDADTEKRGIGVRVMRHPCEGVRLDDPAIRAVIEGKDEQIGDSGTTWSVNADGSELMWGSPKEPAATRSQVDPRDLADAAVRLLAATSDGR